MARILIAEAEERIASFLEKGLRGDGFSTEVAPDGVDALYRVRSGSYALVVLDLSLPDLDGFQVLAALRAEDPTLPVIALTSHPGLDERAHELEGATIEYVTKPFHFDELLARIHRKLGDDSQGSDRRPG